MSKISRLLSNIILIIFTTIMFQSCKLQGPASISDIVEEQHGEKWLITINDSYTLYQEDISEEYQFYSSNNLLLPSYMIDKLINDQTRKEEFIQQITDHYIIYLNAKNDKMLDDKALNIYLKYVIRDAVFQYYLKNKLASRITVDEQEVVDFYNKYKSEFKDSFDSTSEMKIYQILKQQKLEQAYMDYMQKIKENTKIERNSELDI